MAWKANDITDDIIKLVMGVYHKDFEGRVRKDSTYEEWLEWHQVRPTGRWTVAENSLKCGRLVTVRGVEESTSFLLVYDPSGRLVGSFSEHHGEDRGPNRRARVEGLLGKQGLRLITQPRRDQMPTKIKPTNPKPENGFTKPLTPSKALAEVVGPEKKPRSEVVKLLWKYIKKHELQNPENKRMIAPDGALSKVFGGDEEVSMFAMAKLLNKHLS